MMIGYMQGRAFSFPITDEQDKNLLFFLLSICSITVESPRKKIDLHSHFPFRSGLVCAVLHVFVQFQHIVSSPAGTTIYSGVCGVSRIKTWDSAG